MILLDLIAQHLSFGEEAIFALAGVFVRIGAVVALLPGFGEQTLSLRLRLAAAVVFTTIVWPLIMPGALATPLADSALGLSAVFLAEAVVGLMLGLAIRLMIMTLQLAGSIAAQATSVSQIFGAGLTPDPMPAMGNVLVMGGLALALAAGLHVKVAAALIDSYQILPFGRFPFGADVASWGVRRAAGAFSLALSLAAPFVVISLAYNVALGAINRAMPQLMVAFVGAPFITGAALAFLMIAAPMALVFWSDRLDLVLADPFGPNP